MKKTVGIIGSGSLGTIIGEGIVTHLKDSWELVGIYNRTPDKGKKLADKLKVPYVETLELLINKRPDVIIEGTIVDVLKEIAVPVLNAGCDLIPLSIGGFACEAFKKEVEEVARQSGSRIHLVPGAIGGFDFIQGALLKSPLRAKIVSTKSPVSLQGAPGLKEPLPEDREVVAFSGNAKEAILKFPKNVNVAVALSLATELPPEKTEVEIVSVPGLKVNSHKVTIEGQFGSAEFTIQSKPSAINPKSSETAALSVLAKLKNMNTPLAF